MSDTRSVIPVILAGGSGTRLWPLSRSCYPKQFLRFSGSTSLLQQTLQRAKGWPGYSAPIVVTNEDYRFLVAEQAREVGVDLAAILLEPEPRNTAPALAAVAQYTVCADPDAIMHVLPSDHAIVATDVYWKAVETAANAVASGKLLTFGIAPTDPATGYGYIKQGKALQNGVFEIDRFVEKPGPADAQQMLDSGGYVWNSGMFLFEATRFLEEVDALQPTIGEATKRAVSSAETDLDFIRLDARFFAQSPSISIDHAIFEKTRKGAVVPVSIEWSDLGSWMAVWKSGAHDSNQNLVLGAATVRETTSSLLLSEGPHLAVDGVRDLAVVATEDAVFVGSLQHSQNVKELVESLRVDKATRSLVDVHRTRYQPWGGRTKMLAGDHYVVNRVFVEPGKGVSLQLHEHRAEHWVVVRGTAEATIGDQVQLLAENESIFIPRGAIHRLSNPGKIQLELIEVQTGSYLGEDDIIRLEVDQ